MTAKRTKVGNAAFPLVVEVEAVILGVVKLVFDDGYEGVLDLRPQMGRTLWRRMSSWDAFARVQIDEFGSCIFWAEFEGNPIELAADGLRRDCERQEAVHKLMYE
jgi:hypothetical protein